MFSILDDYEINDAIAWRRHLHQFPELALKEYETAEFVASKLNDWGYNVSRKYGETSVVGTLSKGSSSRAIGIRADIDALPIEEKTGLPHSSKSQGVMHACGHDGHTAIALAAAKACQRVEFDGTVHFIFQPAEEAEGGARRMVAAGLFRDLPIDAVFALHNWPSLAVGSIVARDSEMMAALRAFEIQISGMGSHGALPHEGIDPIVAACQIVSALQTIVSRNLSPMYPSVVSATQISGGNSSNVNPDQVTIKGTARWFQADTGATILQRLRELTIKVAEAYSCAARVTFGPENDATVNDPDIAQYVRSLLGAGQGALQVADEMPSMASEDFAYMLNECRGCFIWLGGAKAYDNPGLHSPEFDFNDELISLGANMWLRIITDYLSPKKTGQKLVHSIA